jgi:hypothetical protein
MKPGDIVNILNTKESGVIQEIMGEIVIVDMTPTSNDSRRSFAYHISTISPKDSNKRIKE